MYIRVVNGNPENYSIEQLRRDNPQVSFPKKIPDTLLGGYGVCPVMQTAAPELDSKTHRHAQTIEAVDGEWTQVWRVVELPEHQAADNVRAHRAALLRETDWMALSDNTMSPAWAAYRQALRDISKQVSFPWGTQWPNVPG